MESFKATASGTHGGPNAIGWAAIAALAAGILVGCVWGGWYWGRTAVRVEAIKQGHAKHVITDEYGKTKFEWLEKGDK